MQTMTAKQLAERARANGGVVRVEGDLHLPEDIPWTGCGENVQSISAKGAISATGNISAEGDISAKGYISATGNISAEGDISATGNISAEGNISVSGYMSAEGYISAKGYIHAGGDCVIAGDLYWSHLSMPEIGGRFFHRRVLPRSWQREYWSERLGVKLEGCYDEIIRMLSPRLPRLLKSKKWTPTERWVLGSLTRKNARIPKWAKEILSKKFPSVTVH